MSLGEPNSPTLHFRPYLQHTTQSSARTRLTSIHSPLSPSFGTRRTEDKFNLPKSELGKLIVSPISSLPIEEMPKKTAKSYKHLPTEGSEFLRKSVELNEEDRRREYIHRNVFITDTANKTQPLSKVDNLRKTIEKISKPKISKSNSKKHHYSEQLKQPRPRKEAVLEVARATKQTAKKWDSYETMLQPISEYYEKPGNQANMQTMKLKPRQIFMQMRSRSNTMKNPTRHKSLSMEMHQLTGRSKKDTLKRATTVLTKSVEGKKIKQSQANKLKASQRCLETKELSHTKVSAKWSNTKSGKIKIVQ